jgi:hypothetical protein
MVLGDKSDLKRANQVARHNPYSAVYDPNRAFSSYNIEQQGELAIGIYDGNIPSSYIDYSGCPACGP